MSVEKIKIVILAIAGVIALVIVGALTTMRPQPEEEVARLRTKIDKLLNSEDFAEWESVTTQFERLGKNLNQFQVRIDLARKAADAILKLDPTSFHDVVHRGLIEETIGSFEAALNWYDQASAMEGALPKVELDRARILRRLGRHREAMGVASSVVDVFPFESALMSGLSFIDTRNSLEAYEALIRARNYAVTDNQRRQACGCLAKALNLRIGELSERLGNIRENEVTDEEIKEIELVLEETTKEYRAALGCAIRHWRSANPRTREELVAIELKIFELLDSLDGPENLENTYNVLAEANIQDNNNRNFPIYLLLAYLDFKRAYNSSVNAHDRDKLIAEAEFNLQKALSFKHNTKPRKSDYIRDWKLSKQITPEEIEAEILLKVCRILLLFPEYRRILNNKGPGQREDPLDIGTRLEKALANTSNSVKLQTELKIVHVMALLKGGDLDAFQLGISELMASASKEDKAKLALNIADDIALSSPERIDYLLDFTGNFLFPNLDETEFKDFNTRLVLKRVVEIFHRALPPQFRVRSPNYHRDNSSRLPEDKNIYVDILREKILGITSMIANSSTKSQHYLFSFHMTESYVGFDHALDVLQRAKVRHPTDSSVRFALGKAFWKHAEQSQTEERWKSYKAALREFLFLYESEPYRTEFLSWLVLIASRYKESGISLATDINEITRDLFPGSSKMEVLVLGSVLEAFLARDFARAISMLPSLKGGAKHVRPFLSLIGGICYLEEANRLLKNELSQGTKISINPDTVTPKRSWKQQFHKARREFEGGLSVDDTYIPIQIELMKIKLDTQHFDEEMSTTMERKIQNYVDKYPGIPQLQYLRAVVIKKKIEREVRTEKNSKELLKMISEERVALRRAIRENPYYVDAYLALAETYVQKWRFDREGYINDGNTVYRILSTPNFRTAITVLENAPQVPIVLETLALYHDACYKPEMSLNYYKILASREPSIINLKKVVQFYITLKDLQGARNWLNESNGEEFLRPHFKLYKMVLLALLDSVEARSAEITDARRNLLNNRQMENYRSLIALAKTLDVDPPPEAINNYAYLLCESGRVNEAYEQIIPLISKVIKSESQFPPQYLEDIEETYGRILYRMGKHDEALKVYRRLCSRETKPEIHLNYGEVLFESKEYDRALEQANIVIKSDKYSPILEGRARRLKSGINVSLSE